MKSSCDRVMIEPRADKRHAKLQIFFRPSWLKGYPRAAFHRLTPTPPDPEKRRKIISLGGAWAHPALTVYLPNIGTVPSSIIPGPNLSQKGGKAVISRKQTITSTFSRASRTPRHRAMVYMAAGKTFEITHPDA